VQRRTIILHKNMRQMGIPVKFGK